MANDAESTAHGEDISATRIHNRVLDDIHVERQRQIVEKGYTLEHDDTHFSGDWIAILDDYLARVVRAAHDSPGPNEYRDRLVQVAAIATAATESFDRALAAIAAPKGDAPEGASPHSI